MQSLLRPTFMAIAVPFGYRCNRLLTNVLILGALSLASAQITWDASPLGGTTGATAFELLQDTATPTPSGQYIGLRFSSAAPLTNVYARATVGGVGFALDVTEAADHFIGSLGSTAKTSYWYFNQPPTGNGTFRVSLYIGDPAAGGILQATLPLYTLRSNDADQAAAANKVTGITVNGGNPIQLGQSFDVVVQYTVSSVGPNLLVQPAALATFDPYNLRLGETRVQLCADTACGGVTSTLNRGRRQRAARDLHLPDRRGGVGKRVAGRRRAERAVQVQPGLRRPGGESDGPCARQPRQTC